MSEEPQKRSTYIGHKDWTPRGEVSHLRFVISDFVYDEIMDEECALVVNMTSEYGTSQEDLTCELDVGDHSDITHKSYIVYSMAQRVPKREILENVANKKYIYSVERLSSLFLKESKMECLKDLKTCQDLRLIT